MQKDTIQKRIRKVDRMSDFHDEGWDYGYTDVPDDDMHSIPDELFEEWEDHSDMLDDGED